MQPGLPLRQGCECPSLQHATGCVQGWAGQCHAPAVCRKLEHRPHQGQSRIQAALARHMTSRRSGYLQLQPPRPKPATMRAKISKNKGQGTGCTPTCCLCDSSSVHRHAWCRQHCSELARGAQIGRPHRHSARGNGKENEQRCKDGQSDTDGHVKGTGNRWMDAALMEYKHSLQCARRQHPPTRRRHTSTSQNIPTSWQLYVQHCSCSYADMYAMFDMTKAKHAPLRREHHPRRRARRRRQQRPP